MRKITKSILFVVFFLLFVLHNDFWFWSSTTLVLDLPVGFFYHIVFCIVAFVMFVLLTRFGWPEEIESDGRPG